MDEARTETRHRLFLGLPVPEESASVLGEAAARTLSISGVRPLPPENLHVTLIFFGDVNGEARDELVALTREVRWTPLRVETGAMALMGRTAIAVRLAASKEAVGNLEDRLVRASITSVADLPTAEIASLKARLWSSNDPIVRMQRHVPRPERDRKSRRERVGRALELHITVARAKSRPETLPTRLVDLAFDLERVVLYESHLGPGGSRYETLATSRVG